MTDKITMDGKWAYRKDPFTEVEVWTPKNRLGDLVVFSCATDGVIRSHTVDGFYSSARVETGTDLVPLQRKPREWWLNLYEDGWAKPHRTHESAEISAGPGLRGTVHVREVLD